MVWKHRVLAQFIKGKATLSPRQHEGPIGWRAAGCEFGDAAARENVLLGQAEGFEIPLATPQHRSHCVPHGSAHQLISSSHVRPEIWPPQAPSPGPQCTAALGTS